jgi:radical SAM superfamily enzyme YgiQ (UPF0313 family)
MGGIHASACPSEVTRFIDTVITGEAEGGWPRFLADFEKGVAKPFYDGGLADPANISKARRDIFKYPYTYDLIQTSRGCPWGCDFCSVTSLCGKTYRERDIEAVLDELEETSRPLIFFVDDNLVNMKKGANERAISLFQGMIRRKIKKLWLSQAALNFADDEEVLRWARKSGCVMILIGIEAESVAALKDTKKSLNLKRGVDSYAVTFKRMHKHGISVLGAIIFGMESDTKEDLIARRDFILRSSIDTYQTSILTPLPSTTLYDRMLAKNQIVFKDYPADWKHYHCARAIVDTGKMKHQEIEKVMEDIWLSLYTKNIIRKKMFRTLWNTKSFKTAYWAYAGNHGYGRMFLERIFDTRPDGLDRNFEWKNRKRSLFLKFTDMVLWFFYQTKWKMISRHFSWKAVSENKNINPA